MNGKMRFEMLIIIDRATQFIDFLWSTLLGWKKQEFTKVQKLDSRFRFVQY